MSPIPNIQIRQILLALMIAVLVILLFWNLRFFVPAVLGAYTLYVLLRGPLRWLTDRWHWPKGLATAVLMLLSLAAVVLPLNWLVRLLNQRIAALLQSMPELLANAESLLHNLEQRYGIAILTPANLESLSNFGMREAQGVLGATVNGLIIVLVMFVILWFMLTEGDRMEKSFFDWLPLRAENTAYMRRQLNDLVYANALGIPLMGVVQGLAGLLAYWLIGVPDPWLWFGVTFLTGMMPIFGVALAYIPLSLILLAQGQPISALLVFLYGLIVIGSVDNLARMWLLKKIGHTHPLVTLFGVIAGLKLFGFMGFVFGPIMISLCLLLFKIYDKEFVKHPAHARDDHHNPT